MRAVSPSMAKAQTSPLPFGPRPVHPQNQVGILLALGRADEAWRIARQLEATRPGFSTTFAALAGKGRGFIARIDSGGIELATVGAETQRTS